MTGAVKGSSFASWFWSTSTGARSLIVSVKLGVDTVTSAV